MLLIRSPAANRTAVDGLADLRRARRPNRPPVSMERQTAFVPRQTAMSENTPRLSFKIGNHVFVADIEDSACRQHAMPMIHQSLVALVVAAESGKVIGVVLLRGKQLREA